MVIEARKITEYVSKSFIKLYVFHILSSFMLSFSLYVKFLQLCHFVFGDHADVLELTNVKL